MNTLHKKINACLGIIMLIALAFSFSSCPQPHDSDYREEYLGTYTFAIDDSLYFLDGSGTRKTSFSYSGQITFGNSDSTVLIYFLPMAMTTLSIKHVHVVDVKVFNNGDFMLENDSISCHGQFLNESKVNFMFDYDASMYNFHYTRTITATGKKDGEIQPTLSDYWKQWEGSYDCNAEAEASIPGQDNEYSYQVIVDVFSKDGSILFITERDAEEYVSVLKNDIKVYSDGSFIIFPFNDRPYASGFFKKDSLFVDYYNYSLASFIQIIYSGKKIK